ADPAAVTGNLLRGRRQPGAGLPGPGEVAGAAPGRAGSVREPPRRWRARQPGSMSLPSAGRRGRPGAPMPARQVMRRGWAPAPRRHLARLGAKITPVLSWYVRP